MILTIYVNLDDVASKKSLEQREEAALMLRQAIRKIEGGEWVFSITGFKSALETKIME